MRARTKSGRLLHYRVNPPLIELKCDMCGEPFLRGEVSASHTKLHFCGSICRLLALRLWSPFNAGAKAEDG
ncbi:MAG TPA: hypothetical protein VGR40_11310 [Candidatus Binatus sp.]|nr:hypothetical protein [Candidatus Binatus sp.]